MSTSLYGGKSPLTSGTNITGPKHVTIKKNYESYAQRLKDKAKENSDESNRKGKTGKRRLFAYSFFLMDLKTRMYVAYDSTMNSERDGYDRALAMLRSVGVYS